MLEEIKNFVLVLISMLLTATCSTTPAGRKQLNFMSDGQMTQLGDQSFDKIKQDTPISKDPAQNKLVLCITNHLLKVMGETPSEWEVLVFKDPTPNAFALPGKNIGVHTGMIDLAQNQDQLAAVISHEIGHVLAHHGSERMSQGVAAQLGLTAAEMYLGENSQKNQLILAALGLGAQYGILLPYGRTQESEADRLGVEYMAKAGFDPKQAVQLWRVMKEKSRGSSPPQWMSTHPSNDTRIKDLGSLAPQYEANYQAVNPKPQCGT